MECTKSVLGEFSSSVSICPNKVPQSDLEAPYHQGPTLASTGGVPRALLSPDKV